MLQLKDKRANKWLSAFRLMLLILLPIGQCMAQEKSLNVDMVGLMRRKVQLVMRDYSFSEYKKDHVTYIVNPSVTQQVHYIADTCNSIEFFVDPNYSDAFAKMLSLVVDSVGIKFDRVDSEKKIRFSISTGINRVRVSYTQSGKERKNRKRQRNPVVVEKLTKERIAADERYFRAQKHTAVDNTSHFKILGWNKN